jgi:peptidoglycan/LPS O-acetylase OafA/YrhL
VGSRTDPDRRPGDDERVPVDDLVRFASILLVFAVHVRGTPLPVPVQGPLLSMVVERLVRNGVYGVSIFFVVSGYVITRSIARRTPSFADVTFRGFYARRAGRILPPLLLAIASNLVALTFLGGRGVRTAYCLRDPHAVFDAAFFIALATFAFNWLRIARRHVSPTFGLSWDVLWSLAVEEQFYLVYPLVLRALKTRDRVIMFLLAVVLLGPVARIVSNDIEGSFLVAFTNSFVCFDLVAMGALLFLLLERMPPTRERSRIEPVLGVAAVAVFALVYLGTFLGDADERVWAPSAIGASVAVFLGVGIRRRWFDGAVARKIVYPGQLSYGAYLFHPLVLFLGWRLLRGQSLGAVFGLLAGSTLVLAYFLNRFFEAPANRAVRRWLIRDEQSSPDRVRGPGAREAASTDLS